MIPLFLILGVMVAGSAEPSAPTVVQHYKADGVHDWSSLILYADHSFTYESRGGSCWVWQDWRGTWAKDDNLLFLHYSITIEESRERVAKMRVLTDRDHISVLVTTPEGAPISDALVTLNNQDLGAKTGADGQAVISYTDASDIERGGVLELLTVNDGKHTITFSIDKPRSNHFEIVLDPEPPSRQEAREDVYRVKASKIVLVKDGIPERAKAFGEARPRVLSAVTEETD